MSMAVRVLVAYATKLGSTREIAEVIGRVIRESGGETGVDVDVLAARDVGHLASYDAIVLGSALYAAHWQRDANRFVTHHLAGLQALPVWLFSSGPLDRSADWGRLPVAPAVALTTDPIGARDHRTFGGRLLPDAPVDPQVLATHPVGDFRDWDAIRAWATEIAGEIADLAAGR
jgi:menaquinone-dependent protoporphyrinogen oxidase